MKRFTLTISFPCGQTIDAHFPAYHDAYHAYQHMQVMALAVVAGIADAAANGENTEGLDDNVPTLSLFGFEYAGGGRIGRRCCAADGIFNCDPPVSERQLVWTAKDT